MVYRRGIDGGLKYKVHYSADVKTRIITDCYTTTGSTQGGPILPNRIDYLCDEMGFDVQEVMLIVDMVGGRLIVRLGNARCALIYRCMMLVLEKANSRPLSLNITAELIDTNVQRGIFYTLMRNWKRADQTIPNHWRALSLLSQAGRLLT